MKMTKWKDDEYQRDPTFQRYYCKGCGNYIDIARKFIPKLKSYETEVCCGECGGSVFK